MKLTNVEFDSECGIFTFDTDDKPCGELHPGRELTTEEVALIERQLEGFEFTDWDEVDRLWATLTK